MNTSASQTTAYEIGYLIGFIVGIVIVLGLLAFAVVCIVKAFRKRTKGWIIAGCIAGAVLAIPIIAFAFGIVAGIREVAMDKAKGNATSKPGGVRTVRGQDIAYSIELPLQWKTRRGVMDFDSLNSHKSLYVGVIAEESNLGNPETIAKIARDKVKEVGTDIRLTEPVSLILDGRNWLQYTVDCKVESVPVSYQFYVYAGTEGSFQLIGWTTQELFGRDAPIMRKVMQTFRFPSDAARQID
jgi:hypothetical protein